MDINKDNKLTLQVAKEDFSEFISSLLGKPQTISNSFGGAYELCRDDIESMHHLLTQRVLQQNNASLIQFIAKIAFSDDSTVQLNSFEDFQHYSEIRPLVTTKINLSWSFLIQFQDRKTPEKQEINVAILSGNSNGMPVYDDDLPMFYFLSTGRILFRINHTARSWGADIESLLSGHIKNIILPVSKFRKFIQKNSTNVGFLVAILFFMASLLASFFTAANLWEQQDLAAKALNEPSVQINEKVTYIIKSISDGLWSRYFFSVIMFLIFSFITAVGLGLWAKSAADSNKPSFLLLTKKDDKNRSALLKKYERKGHIFILSIFVSIVSGIAANFIFQYIWSGLI